MVIGCGDGLARQGCIRSLVSKFALVLNHRTESLGPQLWGPQRFQGTDRRYKGCSGPYYGL